MDFKNIIGNESLKALLSSHIKNRSLSHAYIIEGPKGSGKKTLAKEICKALCCTSHSSDLPCGSCRSCKRIEEGYNTDIYILNCGDKASISVDDVRSLTSTIGYYPDDGDIKVYIIEDSEKMTVQAQNALLLSLEEPPSYVIFLLLTKDSTALLETVRSRAQILRCQVFDSAFTADWLRRHPSAKNHSEDDIKTASAVSRGALGEALASLTQKNSKSTAISKDAAELVSLLCGKSRSEAIIFASKVKYSRAEFEEFFDYALLAVRDLICAKCKNDSTTYYPDSYTAAELAKKAPLAKLSRIFDALTKAKEDITKHNAQIYAVMMTLAASAV